jgi:hypothetical protein
MTARYLTGVLVWLCLASANSAAYRQDAPAQTNPAPQTSAPATPQAESQPEEKKEDAGTTPVEAKPESPAEPPRKPENGNKTGPTPRHRAPAKRAAEPPSPESPKRVVVREGGVDEPTAQIVTGMKRDEAARKRDEAELLLSTTAETLKEIAPRPLDAQHQETVSQIHNYMEGARAALKEGAISRAHTLAEKASLLANDLAKQ